MSSPEADRQQAGPTPRRATGLLSIDFGTCFSSAGFVWNGDPFWVKDPLTSLPSVPTSVFWNGDGFLVGQAAENAQLNEPTSFVREFKRDLGRQIPYVLGGREYLPEDLVVVMLRFLRDGANRMAAGLDAPAFTAARIAVPATYAPNRRELMVEAARQAGFTTVELIDEPVAAARSYGGQLAEGETLLVYDLGGGTFDATLLRRVDHDYRVVGLPTGSPQLGGVDFDHLVFRSFVEACAQPERALLTSNDAGDRRSLWTRIGVAEFCRRQKHQLSVEAVAGGLYPLGRDMVDYQLDRERFNGMIAPLVEESLGLCEQMLQVAGVEGSQLGRVLMVGGSCRIPYIQQSLAERFQRPVVLAADPELAVAAGGLVEVGPPQSSSTPAGPSPGSLIADLDRLLSPSVAPPVSATAADSLLTDLDQLLNRRAAARAPAPSPPVCGRDCKRSRTSPTPGDS